MAVSAHDVARALRARVPGMGSLKLHKLLYYCQGHHLAATGEPLFSETISAWDNGPVVGQLYGAERYREEPPPPHEMIEAQLNTIGYVVSRYGGLTANDLVNMCHQEMPFRLADQNRSSKGSVRIELSWLQEYFATDGAAGDEELEIDPEVLQDMLTRAEERRDQPGTPDSIERILDRIRQLSA